MKRNKRNEKKYMILETNIIKKEYSLKNFPIELLNRPTKYYLNGIECSEAAHDSFPKFVNIIGKTMGTIDKGKLKKCLGIDDDVLGELLSILSRGLG